MCAHERWAHGAGGGCRLSSCLGLSPQQGWPHLVGRGVSRQRRGEVGVAGVQNERTVKDPLLANVELGCTWTSVSCVKTSFREVLVHL